MRVSDDLHEELLSFPPDGCALSAHSVHDSLLDRQHSRVHDFRRYGWRLPSHMGVAGCWPSAHPVRWTRRRAYADHCPPLVAPLKDGLRIRLEAGAPSRALPVHKITALERSQSSISQLFVQGVVLTWGALRGAIGLAMAAIVHHEQNIPHTVREKVYLHMSGIVALTLVVNGSTMGWALGKLGYTVRSKARNMLATKAVIHLEQVAYEEITKVKRKKAYNHCDWATGALQRL